MTEERRKFIRLNMLTDVIYTKLPLQNRKELSLTKNIGQGGICIISYEMLKEQELLELKIYLPEDNVPINTIGRVAWTKEFIIGDSPREGKRYDVGLEFIKISDEDMDKIKKYVFTRH